MAQKDVPLILASASPRRKEILEAHGYSPIVMPADVDEQLPPGAVFTPEKATIYLAELKANAVFEALAPRDWPHSCTVLGVDTIVYKDRIIGKPVDEADALDILRSLKNTSHQVISGACLIRAGDVFAPSRNPQATGSPIRFLASDIIWLSDTTTVQFGDYTDDEILEYIRANPPYDKSGSYAIQSAWGRHVLSVDGDIENVIGLPFKRLSAYLEDLCQGDDFEYGFYEYDDFEYYFYEDDDFEYTDLE
ncbi:MAG: Maf family protein [Clostridiales bacterium]|nr:Maf family protein [Clostridiales bacterium]